MCIYILTHKAGSDVIQWTGNSPVRDWPIGPVVRRSGSGQVDWISLNTNYSAARMAMSWELESGHIGNHRQAIKSLGMDDDNYDSKIVSIYRNIYNYDMIISFHYGKNILHCPWTLVRVNTEQLHAPLLTLTQRQMSMEMGFLSIS